MIINKSEVFIPTLQLIKSDGISVEESATVSFKIYDTSATVVLVGPISATYNSNTKSYIYAIDPSIEWINQSVGTYLLVWNVSNTEEIFTDTYSEELIVNIDNDDIQRILGLVHQNIEIDSCEYDNWHNMTGARVRIFKDSAKTEILATYRVNCDTIGPGRFSNWTQVEE